eukprot:m.23484 g.23484  ORF g.23484 m.23484 type:complete len:239 (+) comp5548_c0_seq1:85-801(+)
MMQLFGRQVQRVGTFCVRSQVQSLVRPTVSSSSSPFFLHSKSIFTKASDKVDDSEKKEPVESEGEEVPVFTKSQYEEMESKLTKEANEWKDQLARTIADKENFRIRMERQVEEAEGFSIRKFAKDIVEVADVLQMAIDNVPKEKLNNDVNSDLVNLFEGLQATQKMLHKKFDRHDVKTVNPLKEKFDPDFHEAKFEVPHEHADGLDHGHVHAVTQLGYTIKGRVLRPAHVGVVKKPLK